MKQEYNSRIDEAIIDLAKVSGKWTKLTNFSKKNGVIAGEPVEAEYAMNRVIDIIVDAREAFIKEWNKVTGNVDLDTHDTLVVLVDNERMKELSNLLPINPEITNLNSETSNWCVSWLSCTYNTRKDAIVTMGGIPTLIMVKDVKLLLKRIISDSVDPNIYEIMNISETGKIVAVQTFFDQTNFWNTAINYIRHRGIVESFTKKLLKLKYIKKIKK